MAYVEESTTFEKFVVLLVGIVAIVVMIKLGPKEPSYNKTTTLSTGVVLDTHDTDNHANFHDMTVKCIAGVLYFYNDNTVVYNTDGTIITCTITDKE